MSRTVEQWIEAAITNGGYQRFDDLHVDEIDPRYKDRIHWVSAASDALNRAAAIRDEQRLPFTIAIGMGLAASENALNSVPSGADELNQAMDLTPPSLYAFPIGNEPWVKEAGYRAAPMSPVPEYGPGQWYIREQFDEVENEFSRTLWFAK